MTRVALALALVLAPLLAGPARADDATDFMPGLDWNLLVDLRLVHSSETRSWLKDGLGKARFGPDDDGGGAETRLEPGEASILLFPRLSSEIDGLIHVRAAPEQRRLVDLVEGFMTYAPAVDGTWAPRLQLGLFFPHISLENDGLAWGSTYAVTPSAINSWVGEELRTLGGEAGLTWRGFDHTLDFSLAAFGFNDTAGTLLTFRGWALHDRFASWDDRFDLAPLPQFNGILRFQDPFTEPFREIDGRIGLHAAMRLEARDSWELTAFWYDNMGNPDLRNGGQYAWDTRFVALGGRWRLPIEADVELLAQGMAGNTKMGPRLRVLGGRRLIDNDFASAYLLASWRSGIHQLTARADWFAVDDNDALRFVGPGQGFQDPNDEEGWALLGAYTIRPFDGHRIVAEILHVDSDRPARALIGGAAETAETQLQLVWRVVF